MFGEQYQVDYIINLQDNASAGMVKFSKAASKLANATKNFEIFQKRFNEMTVTFNKQLELKISTSRANTKLNRVIKQLKTIHDLSKGINVGVAGSVGSAANKKVVTTTVTTQTTQTSRAKQQQGPRPIVAPKGKQPLVPRNLEYQVLGPTRLGNVAMLDMFKGMGLMYGISAIGSGMRDIISQSAEYENIMQTAKNILKTNYKGGNFNVSFADMERIVREVGVETKFTAPEVADAVKFLAMAGLDINAINKSIRPIADIALIGDTDLGQTADVMTNIMTAYGIKPDNMRKTANIMTRTFTMSNTTLMELAESFKMAGSMLHLANVPFETAAAAFGVLGDAGIKATMAGTTMRTIMNNLRNPTKNQQKYWDMLGIRRYDEYGNLREINEIFADLNKLNGNDERSKRARGEYEKLQKQIAPKLEGLEEGSAEYNKVLADFDYEKKSEAIRKQYGGVDVFRLFRLTAASGAGVLMNSVEKWNKIISENFLSDGLSQKLADEKKNTIAGMWAQLKSAFQEGGLKVFEENDGRIRGYLQRGVSWLKSAEFTDLLRSVFDLVADLGKMLLLFTKNVVVLYDRFKPLVKYFLEFQLILKGIQLIVGSGKMFGNALLYTFSPIFNAAANNALIQKKMPGLFGFSNAFSAYSSSINGTAINGGSNGLVNGMNPLIAYWFTGRNGKGMPQAPLQLATNQNIPIPRQMPFDPAIISRNVLYNKELRDYNKRVQRANHMQANAAWSGMAGAIAGSYLGSAIAPNSEWAGAIGGISGSLGAMALSSMAIPGAGWIAAGVIGAAAATAAVIKHVRAVNDAKRAADAYVESMSKFDVASLNVANTSDYVAGQIQIENNVLLSQNEKLRAGIELWEKYYAAKNGEGETMDKKEGGYLYGKDSYFAELTDEGSKFWTGSKYLSEAYNKFKETEEYKNALSKGWIPESVLSEKNDIGRILTLYALNADNKVITDVSTFLGNKLTAVQSLEDLQNVRKQFEQQFLTPKDGKMVGIAEEIGASAKDLKKWSYERMLQMPSFNWIMTRQLNEMWDKATKGYAGLFDEGNQSKDYLIGIQNKVFAGMIGDKLFGESGFDKQFNDAINEIQKVKNYTSLDLEQYKIDRFISILELFNQTKSDIQKRAILPMLNRDYWEQVLGVDLSGVAGGFNMPTQKNPHPYGEMFKWNPQKGYYEYGGMPSYPGLNGETWTYKPVTPTEAETAVAATSNGNATIAQAYQIPFYRPGWMPENTMPPLNNEAFRPVERKQMAVASRPLIININADRIMDVSNIDIDNQYDTDTLKNTFVDFLVETCSDVANNNGGLFNLGVAYG